ncbi:MAG: LL-diaminopimelate aminotransferase [Lachnospiraceae bacterium]|nr:LL-diaminopimelate aminotransferase [Lachnospiraceae bacterium]
MITPNMNYSKLKESYLFFNIAKKTKKYLEENPDKKLLRLGIGDVSLPLCDEVIKALHSAVDDQSVKERFHGYMPEVGAQSLRERIAAYYNKRNVNIEADEVFVSSGASDELGDILDLFDKSSNALIIEPAYPAYVDASIMAGREIIHLPSSIDDGFLPLPKDDIKADLIYLCSPNNPTGAVYNKEQLKAWVDYANKNGSIIIFDAAYEAFIEDDTLPHSIFEIEGARECAIEICSLSKTAGFTGTRMGYTIIPKTLVRAEMNLNAMWVRNRTTKTNGVSYIIQKGGAAVFTEAGQKQIHDNINIYKNNATYLMEVLDKLGIWYCGGKNSPYIWMKCPKGMGSWEFFDYLLTEIQVVGTPGEGFGACGEGYFRFSMFGSNEDTKEAARRIYELLK